MWRTRPVMEQAGLTLREWQVVQLPNGDRHLIGWCVENREGRVSSAVRDIDYKKLIAISETGRLYVLEGRPGADPDPDGQYVWSRWTALNAVEAWEDVTESVWSRHEGASE